MDWIKHYGKASMDPRMEKVIDEMGCFGVGLYWRLCERIQCWGNGNYPRTQLVNELKCRRLNSRHIHALLDRYNLFVTSPEGYVSLAPVLPGEPASPQPSDAPQPVSRGTSVHTSQRAHAYKEREKKEDKYPATLLPEWILPYREYNWYPSIVRLLDSDHSAWKEVVCMQSGYSGLLARHWESAVRQFVLHIIAYDTAGQIQTPEEARYYFNSFVKLTSKSGQVLKAQLEQIGLPALPDTDPYRYEEQIDGVRYADGRPIPPTAPPRPSPTAVWNDSCDTWSSFYEH